jgi:hypothetical protein
VSAKTFVAVPPGFESEVDDDVGVGELRDMCDMRIRNALNETKRRGLLLLVSVSEHTG